MGLSIVNLVIKHLHGVNHDVGVVTAFKVLEQKAYPLGKTKGSQHPNRKLAE